MHKEMIAGAFLLLCVAVTARALIQMNDPTGKFRSYFNTQLEEQHWTLRVSTVAFGSDFVAFFATDNNR